MMPSEKAISPKVVMRYPMIGRAKGYRKRENRIQTTLFHSIPLQMSLILPLGFFCRLFVTKRTTANAPTITPDKKGNSPGPGE